MRGHGCATTMQSWTARMCAQLHTCMLSVMASSFYALLVSWTCASCLRARWAFLPSRLPDLPLQGSLICCSCLQALCFYSCAIYFDKHPQRRCKEGTQFAAHSMHSMTCYIGKYPAELDPFCRALQSGKYATQQRRFLLTMPRQTSLQLLCSTRM